MRSQKQLKNIASSTSGERVYGCYGKPGTTRRGCQSLQPGKQPTAAIIFHYKYHYKYLLTLASSDTLRMAVQHNLHKRCSTTFVGPHSPSVCRGEKKVSLFVKSLKSYRDAFFQLSPIFTDTLQCRHAFESASCRKQGHVAAAHQLLDESLNRSFGLVCLPSPPNIIDATLHTHSSVP